ncbi:MAG TPA: NDP-sugar synthase, partial [Candidatus Thermoplasmatota archaeon]|nr:NDP-sugar synthase [Candidatus Thermoplasmatota archaeon]
RNCEAHLRSDDLLVLNADIVSDMDLAALVALRRTEDAPGAISLKEVPAADVVNFGVIRPAGGPGCAEAPDAVRIAEFVEKPKTPREAPSRLINAGAYALDRKVLDLIPPGRLVSLEKEIFPQLVKPGFWGLPFAGAWIDVGDPERLRAASRHLDPGYRFGPDGRLASDARFEESVAGRTLVVGSRAVVRRSVLGDNVTVRAGVVLEDCVVGDRETVERSAKGERVWSRPLPAGYPTGQVGNAL